MGTAENDVAAHVSAALSAIDAISELLSLANGASVSTGAVLALLRPIRADLAEAVDDLEK